MRIMVYTNGIKETESFDEAVALGIEKNIIFKEIEAPNSAMYEAEKEKVDKANLEKWVAHGRDPKKYYANREPLVYYKD